MEGETCKRQEYWRVNTRPWQPPPQRTCHPYRLGRWWRIDAGIGIDLGLHAYVTRNMHLYVCFPHVKYLGEPHCRESIWPRDSKHRLMCCKGFSHQSDRQNTLRCNQNLRPSLPSSAHFFVPWSTPILTHRLLTFLLGEPTQFLHIPSPELHGFHPRRSSARNEVRIES